MEITIPAASIENYGKSYITNQNTLRIGQTEGDYSVIRGVDFGKGMEGFRVMHGGAEYGTALVEVRLDSLDGKSVGICTCSARMDWRFHRTIFGIRLADEALLDATHTVNCEIEKTTGIHDVYLVFHRKAEYIRFGFTVENPYKNKAYTPIPKKFEREDFADTWEATDMLGRKIPSPEECSEKRDKKVGIFYWGNADGTITEPENLTEALKKWPEAEADMDHPMWRYGPYHWGKPLYGYYRNADPYVLRKHAVMLASAGVDFIVFDCTNVGYHAKRGHMALLEAFRQAKLDGINVPKVSFMLNWSMGEWTNIVLRAMYQDIYKPGLYSDLWFMHEGKPLLISFPPSVEEAYGQSDAKLLKEIDEFFTYRYTHGGYTDGPRKEFGNKEWAWLEILPLHKFGEREDGSCEEVAVGVAQNCSANTEGAFAYTFFNDDKTFGRSYTKKDGHLKLTEDSYKYGYNFQEQWDEAHKIDPDIVFVTGWNEWIVAPISGRSQGGKAPGKLGGNEDPRIGFCDQFDRERSRDIEPDCDGYLDTYLLQLTANIRRFKGTNKLPKASGEIKNPESIDWSKVKPLYINMKGTTPKRDFPGWGKTLRYKVEKGRNDIIEARVARDKENLYFYAKCAENIKDADKENAMVLYLDLDRSKKTGWEGYEFRVAGKELQKAYKTHYKWEKVCEVKKKIKGDTIVITISKKKLGLNKDFDIEFKWSDNAFTGERKAGDIMDFYIGGVVAPVGRFNFRYKTK